MSSISTSQPITFVAALRDMIQSLYGGGMPHDTYELLNFYRLIREFNEAGPVKIVGVEGHGGALPQYDAINKRWPLRLAENITAALHRSIVQRPLIRGPFGVRLDALHYDDLEWTLQQIAKAGGAQKGHRVVFKLFEAQNRPEEYVASLKIIDDMRKAGYNVACEVAMVISEKPDLDAEHYRKVAASLLSPELFKQNGIDPAVVAGFTLKDMIGGVKASAHTLSNINARNLTQIAMETVTAFCKATGHKGMYIGSHTHDIGNAIPFLTEAGQTYAAHKEKHPHVTEFQQDVTAEGFGFADLPKLLKSLVGVGAMAEGMSAAQDKIWQKMRGFLDAAAEHYAKARIDANKWPKELLEYGQLASGGLPYVERGSDGRGGIQQFVKFISTNFDPNGVPISEERAREILRCVFASVNGLLARDMGNAHSVTPAMKYLNDLTLDVMSSLLANDIGLVRMWANVGDMKRPLDGPNETEVFRRHYESFRNIQAMAYFCTPMPTAVAPSRLALLRGKLFDYYFPKEWADLQKVDASNTASMLKHLDATKYAEVRTALSTKLIDKDASRAILLADDVLPKDKAARAAYLEAVDFFVAAHIEVNRLPINHGVKPIRESKIEAAVRAFCEKSGGLRAARRGLERGADVIWHGTFIGLLLRPRKGAAIASALETFLTGAFTSKRGWPPAAMNGTALKFNGERNGHGSNGNGGNGHAHGNGIHAEEPKPFRPPGIKGKDAAPPAAGAEQANAG